MVGAGWKVDVATLDNLAGAVSMSKDGKHVTATYTDTGFLPAEVSFQAVGVELKQEAR